MASKLAILRNCEETGKRESTPKKNILSSGSKKLHSKFEEPFSLFLIKIDHDLTQLLHAHFLFDHNLGKYCIPT